MTLIDLIATFPAGTDLPGPHTPPVVRDGVAMAYLRLTEADTEAFRHLPDVDVLVEEPFDGNPAATANRLYAALLADAGAAAAYAAVYPRTPWVDEDGTGHLPPERIGQVG